MSMSVKNVAAITFMCPIIKVFHFYFEPRSYYRTKHPCLFHLSGILPEPRFYYRIKFLRPVSETEAR